MFRSHRNRTRAGLAAALLAAAALPAAVAAAPADGPTLHVDPAKVKGTWKEGWFRGGKVALTGTVGEPSKLTVVIRPKAHPKKVTTKVTFNVAAPGAFKKTIALTARPLPGRYTLRVTGTGATADLAPVTHIIEVPKPPEGVVDRFEVSTKRGGPHPVSALPTFKGKHDELWFRFRFLAKPDSRKVKLVFRSHWKMLLGVVVRNAGTVIDAYVKDDKPLQPGVWTVTLTVDGRIAKRAGVRLANS